MGIFSRVFEVFKKSPHHDLLNEYSRIQALSSLLTATLAGFRTLQRQLVQQNITGSAGPRTGGVRFEKTLFIEEELIHKLRLLARKAEGRFLAATEKLKHTQPVSPLEREELQRILHFLEELQARLPNLAAIREIDSSAEKLDKIEAALGDVVALSRTFYETERYERDLIRRVTQHEISPLLVKIYTAPQLREYTAAGRRRLLFTYTVTPRQLEQLTREAEKINAAQDPNFKVMWRRWWRGEQVPEVDVITPLKDPHVNVTLSLFGQPKKEIHLLLAS